MNLYGYVGGDPVSFVDPWGLNPGATTLAGAQIGTALGGPVGGFVGGAIGLGIGLYGGQQAWDWMMNEGIDDNTDMTDPSTWPKSPVDGECEEGDPSRKKPRDRGERSLWDSDGGEWRAHKPDKHHPEGHWDHKPSGANRPWTNVPI